MHRPPLELLSAHSVLHPELPQDLDAERQTLSCVLANRQSLLAVSTWLLPEMFYAERYGIIYAAMLRLLAQRITPDITNLIAALGPDCRADVIGLLQEDYAVSSEIQTYARRIERAYHERQLIDAGSKIAALGYRAGDCLEERQARAHTLLTQATTCNRQADLVSGSDAATEAWNAIENNNRLVVDSGWADLDDYTGGFQAGDYAVVGARPSVGKTSWALSLLRNVCRAGFAHPLLFELEMDRQQMVHRLVSMETGVPALSLRRRDEPDEATYRMLAEGIGTVGSWQWTVCDLAGQTPSQIRSRTMRHIADYPDSIVIVDYLGLMTPENGRENRTQEVAGLSLALRNLARDANVPLIALAQLSRAPEARSDHRPNLADLRDSGGIEQDATHVLFLYRDELYDPQSEKKGIAEVIIAKNRFGPIGVIPMRFDATTTRFDTLSYRDEGNYCR